MNVAELIVELRKLPQDAPVKAFWDGAARSDVEGAYLSRCGQVVLIDEGEKVLYVQDEPYEGGLFLESRT